MLAVDSPTQLRRSVPLGTGAKRAMVILAAMVLLLATGLVPPAVAALLAACALVLTRTVTVTQAYHSISWTTVVLIAGMIPLSTAFIETGTADLVAGWLLSLIGDTGPHVALLALVVLTVVLGQLISNTATVLIVAPIAVSVAATLGLSVQPFMMALTVAGAASFLTPIATPANLMVFESGGYRFGDYWKLGLPLALSVHRGRGAVRSAHLALLTAEGRMRGVGHGAGFWIVAVVFLTTMAYSTVPTPLYPLYEQRDGFPVSLVTVIYSAFAVGVMLSLYLFGHVSDWFGRRPMLVIAVAISVVSAAMFLLWPETAGLIAARTVNGVSIGIMSATATAHLGELRALARPQESPVFATSVAGAANLGGLALGSLIGGLLAEFAARSARDSRTSSSSCCS